METTTDTKTQTALELATGWNQIVHQTHLRETGHAVIVERWITTGAPACIMYGDADNRYWIRYTEDGKADKLTRKTWA